MKQLILSFIIGFNLMACSQKLKPESSPNIITQTLVHKQGKQIILKNIVEDSRCPIGVTCVWAGQVKIVLSVYDNNKFVEEKEMTFSPEFTQQNVEWFSSYYPHLKISDIAVFPHPQKDLKIEPKDYYLKISL